jgi:hypothetical protein
MRLLVSRGDTRKDGACSRACRSGTRISSLKLAAVKARKGDFLSKFQTIIGRCA